MFQETRLLKWLFYYGSDHSSTWSIFPAGVAGVAFPQGLKPTFI
jgi:hypothetical protein